MRFHLFSDLHLEFAPFELPGGDVLLLAGDVTVAAMFEERRTDKQSFRFRNQFEKFFAEECSKYSKVFYVAGNHEHYNGTYELTHDRLRGAVEGTNVQFLENETVDLGDVLLYGATFWTDFDHNNPMAKLEAQRGMNDYHIIRSTKPGAMYTQSGSLHPDDTYNVNAHSRSVLAKVLDENPDKKVLVMTHMAPSMKSSHPRYGGTSNLLNYAYSNQMDRFVEERPNLKVWVHGHTHESHQYWLGDNCRVYCNPRGYAHYNRPGEQENVNFNPQLSFEV